MIFDEEPACLQGVPSLSTVKLPVHEMGAVAVKVLAEVFMGRRPEVKDTKYIPELVVRGSLGLPPAE